MNVEEGASTLDLAKTMPDEVLPPPLPQGATALRAGGKRLPLFCVAPMADADSFTPLASHLPSDLPVVGLDAAHVPFEELALESVEEQAARLLETLRAVQPEGPYRLAGFSFGAHVAFEISRRLVESGGIVECLAILDTAPVDDIGSIVPRWTRDARDLLRKAPSRMAMAFRARHEIAVLLRKLWRARRAHGAARPTIGECLEAIRLEVLRHGTRTRLKTRAASKTNTASAGVGDEVRRGRLIAAAKRAMVAYRMEPRPVCICLVASTRERSARSRARIEAQWRCLALSGFEVCWIDCGHLDILRGAGVAEVASAIARSLGALDAARGRSTGVTIGPSESG